MQLLLALALFAGAAADTAPAPCRAADEGKALDFWIGAWTVTSEDGATPYGVNRIEMALDGCAIFENWTGSGGGEGKSLFSFDARRGAWDQV